jgi:hypothetical protein
MAGPVGRDPVSPAGGAAGLVAARAGPPDGLPGWPGIPGRIILAAGAIMAGGEREQFGLTFHAG